MSSNRSSYSKKQRPKQQGYGSLVCTSCEPRVLFPTHDALLKHMEEKRAQNPQDHIHCKFCGDDFITPEAERYHIQEVRLTFIPDTPPPSASIGIGGSSRKVC